MNELEITTKIGRRNPVNGSAKGKNKPVPGNKLSSGNVDKVTFSDPSKAQASASKSKTIASEIRHELVNKFRDILQNGSYEVKANEIADKIVQKIRENKYRLVL
jgi:flagellar biosynthesis anti-sigma factor FlgM